MKDRSTELRIAGAGDTEPAKDPDSTIADVAVVPIGALLPADSPRLLGIDEEHARLLAEVETDLPPILVQRGSMRVIDGMHRLRAAHLNGQAEVAVRFFDGSDAAAFLHAVSANVKHGFPLSATDREVSAIRIIQLHPHLSDRAVAQTAGLSGKTVGALRQRSGADLPQLETRMGRDGKIRPLNGAIGRKAAGELLLSKPEASLREVARAAGISPATVRDVRDRLRRGEDPVPDRQRSADAASPAPRRLTSVSGAAPENIDSAVVLANLRRDPSLRYTESGRTFLRWLDRRLMVDSEYDEMVGGIPPHCLPIVARLARQCVEEWRAMTEMLEERVRTIA